ncbi:MAG: GNAT family N-acetyltransferase [Actinomycetota bacterium]|nr:GNAT family N-acetyltransferase [Actinomycetota bacterium]
MRRAGLEDVGDVARIHVESWRAAYRGLIADEALAERTVEVRVKQWTKTLGAPPTDRHTLYVAERGGSTVGFAWAGPSDDHDVDPAVTVNIYALYLDPARRGEGIGAALLEHVVDDFASRGFTRATLYVLVGNDPARRFYERAGWELDAGVTKPCLGDGYEAPQVRYSFDLASRSARAEHSA